MPWIPSHARKTPATLVSKTMPRLTLFLALLVATAAVLAQDNRDSERQRRAEGQKAEDIRDLTRRMSRQTGQANVPDEALLIHSKVSLLLKRAEQAAAGSYLFRQLEDAMDDLLDGSEDIIESREEDRDPDEDDQQDSARFLERAFFRVRQGDYFAGLSKERDGGEYVELARRLYQQARAAYDAAEYRRAERLAAAAMEVIEGLENLAEAAVPIPDPPRL